MRLSKRLLCMLCVCVSLSSLGLAGELGNKLAGFYVFKGESVPAEIIKYEQASINVENWLGVKREVLLGWGYQESRHQDLIVFNDPRKKYSNGVVKRFSVDFGFCGINSQNWGWVEKEAWDLYYAGIIPIRPYPLPVHRLADWRWQWQTGRDMTNIKFECNQECVESMMIYRVLIEGDRKKWDWSRDCESWLMKQSLRPFRERMWRIG